MLFITSRLSLVSINIMCVKSPLLKLFNFPLSVIILYHKIYLVSKIFMEKQRQNAMFCEIFLSRCGNSANYKHSVIIIVKPLTALKSQQLTFNFARKSGRVKRFREKIFFILVSGFFSQTPLTLFFVFTAAIVRTRKKCRPDGRRVWFI